MLRKSSLVVALTFTLGALLASAEPAGKAQAAAPAAAKAAADAPAAPAAVPAAPATAAPAAPQGEATEKTIVYLAKSGSRYHTKDCRYLNKKPGKEITIGDAMKQGYAPCNVCKAPRIKR